MMSPRTWGAGAASAEVLVRARMVRVVVVNRILKFWERE